MINIDEREGLIHISGKPETILSEFTMAAKEVAESMVKMGLVEDRKDFLKKVHQSLVYSELKSQDVSDHDAFKAATGKELPGHEPHTMRGLMKD